MSAMHRHGVIPSFFFAAVFFFATSASATEVPFERLPYGVPLHSEQPADGATSSVAPSNGSGAHNLTVRRPGAPAGEAVVLAAYRTRAVRDPQPRSGVQTRSGSFGPQPFQVAGSGSGLPFGRSSSTGAGSTGRVAALAPTDGGTDGRQWGNLDDFGEAPDGGDTGIIPIPDDDEPGPRLWGDADEVPGSRDFGSSSAPLPEPSAALVFGLGALLVKSATRRSRR